MDRHRGLSLRYGGVGDGLCAVPHVSEQESRGDKDNRAEGAW